MNNVVHKRGTDAIFYSIPPSRRNEHFHTDPAG